MNSTEFVKTATIFVSIPSYRDCQCPTTIADCFRKARYPNRIVIGVCQQNEEFDIDCLEGQLENDQEIIDKYNAEQQIRIMRLTADQAQGPVYARHLIERDLFHDEDYFLQIDSHTLFAWHWDVNCIDQLLSCCNKEGDEIKTIKLSGMDSITFETESKTKQPNETEFRPILTCYPSDFDLQTRELALATEPGMFLKFRNFHPRLGFAQVDPVRFRYLPSHPMPSLFWGGCFSFTTGKTIRLVPYDPNLRYVFLGEEISMTARYYTHGCDLFAPVNNIVYHHVERTYRPTFWELFYKRDGQCKVHHDVRTQRKQLEAEGNLRLKRLLRGELPLDDKYGLGTIRSLKDFQNYCGLDMTNYTFQGHAINGLTQDPSADEYYFKYGLRI
jgi:[Skp1-protein]-hydroxyproline N-acetylglucosaminyltransferase